MKRIHLSFFLVTMLSMGQTCWSATLENPAGIQLAQRVYDRAAGNDVSSLVAMNLKSRSETVKQRLLHSYAKEKGNAERWSLMRFIEPKDIAGTGLLTQDHAGDNSDQWLYLPALDRVRRISSSRKGGRFVGSDFYYEDLMDREVAMDYHFFEGHAKIGKTACDILISTPRQKSNSVYSKRVSCIHRKLFIALKVDFYKNGRRKPFKQLRARKIKKIQGYWTVLDSTMYDLKSGHQTQLFTKRIKYNQNLPDALFKQQALSDDSKERAYKP